MTTDDQGQEDDKGTDDQTPKNDGQTGDDAGGDDGDQSGGADKAPTLEELGKLVPELQKSLSGLTKGYTQTRQDMAEINKNLGAITEAMNKKTGAEEGDEDYVTQKGMKEIIANALSDNVNSANKQKEDNETAIDNALTGLRAEGVISSKEDEDSLIKHAVKIEQPDLRKAALSWQEVKKAGEDAVKDAAKREAKKKEGDGVGSPSGSTGSEQGGVDYAKLKKMQESGEL